MSETPTPNPNNTNALAFVIDNEVVLMMRTDDRAKAVFSSSPTVVDITDYKSNTPNVGWTWDGTYFHPPVSE